MNPRKIAIKLNQDFAFLKLMMRGKKAKMIFFPGCAFMKLDFELIDKVLSQIKKIDKNASACSLCCGRPSQVLGKKYYTKHKEKVANFIRQREVETIYTACPNCRYTLNEIKDEFGLDVNVTMLYKLISDNIDDIVDTHIIEESVVIHDPCAIRNDEVTHQSIRHILDSIKQKYVETKFNKQNTICCGNINMLNVLDPGKSLMILNKRIDELKEKANVICSYCSGCLNSFEKAGVKVVHIVELVFGKAKSKSFANRIKFTASLSRN